MKSRETAVRQRLRSFHPQWWRALFAVLPILVAGCASWEKSAPPAQQAPLPELLGGKDIDPAMRKRIALAAGPDSHEETLRDTLEQRPGDIDAAIRLLQSLLAQRRHQEALEVVDNVLAAVPGDLRALNATGVILDHEGRHREAQAVYRQALSTEPVNPMLRHNLDLSLALDGTERELP